MTNIVTSAPDAETDPNAIHKDGTTTTTAAIPFAEGASIPVGKNLSFGDDFRIRYEATPPPLGRLSFGFYIPDSEAAGFDVVYDNVWMGYTNYYDGSVGDITIWNDSGSSVVDVHANKFRVNYGTPPTGFNEFYGDSTFFDKLIIDDLTASALVYTNASKEMASVTLGDNLELVGGTLRVIKTPKFGNADFTAATGAAPFMVASTTVVTRLNADLLDGAHTGTSGAAVGLLNGGNTHSGLNTFSSTSGIRMKAGSASSTNCSLEGTLSTNITATGNVGTGEDDLHTTTIFANTLSVDGRKVRLTAAGDFAANANNKRVRCYYGGTLVFDTTALAFNESTWVLTVDVVRTAASAQLAIARWQSSDALLRVTTAITAVAVSNASNQTLKCTGEATSDNDIRERYSTVEYLPAAP